jgi:hypothetical protein
MNNLNCIIFSLNRSCQVELLLRSMKLYFKEFDQQKINILYKCSNLFFKEGYDKLIEEYPSINFVLENDFKNDLISLIKNNKYTIFFVDDIIWKEPFSLNCADFKLFQNNENILTYSLRLHPNLTYCYTANVLMNPTKSKLFTWYSLPGDYGYPMSLDGHFFRTDDIMNLLINLPYNNPNQLEAMMSMRPLNKPLMLCSEKSIIFNNPCNKVQTNNPNRHGNISAEYLNENFLNDYIIDLEPFKHLNNESCHKEISITLIKK